MENENDITNIEEKIKQYDKDYYLNNISTISDDEYDQLKHKLYNLKKMDTFKQGIHAVGANENNERKKIKHTRSMLSIGNAFNQNDILTFYKKVNNYLNSNSEFLETYCEVKIDGLSFSAVFDKGELQYVATRGNGIEGEDVTRSALFHINKFPICLNTLERTEIRGEVFLSKDKLKSINKEKDRFSNARNAASGILRTIYFDNLLEKCLDYRVYDIEINNTEFNLYTEKVTKIKELKLPHIEYNILCSQISHLNEFYEEISSNKSSIAYDIDGVVCKINDTKIQDRLGYTNISRSMIAYKMPSKCVMTKIINVNFQVGKNGHITPVAIMDDVVIEGSSINRATLHNMHEIERLNIAINDYVYLKKSGDVIPKIYKLANKSKNSVAIQIPTTCPSCKTKLIQRGKFLQCTNVHSCYDIRLNSMSYAYSKPCLNIEGLSKGVIKKLMDNELISTIADIFKLKHQTDKIRSIPGFGDTSANNILNSVERSKNVAFSSLINTLNIPGIGILTSKEISDLIDSSDFIDCISNNNINPIVEKLKSVNGIGEVAVKSINDFFDDEINVKNTLDLISEVNVTKESKLQNLNGFTVMFTGKLNEMKRLEAKDLSKNKGFTVLSSISSNLNYLIIGDKASKSKIDKATSLGCKILSEKEFLQMLK